ncbi:UvrD-helicase domain-containing protein [Patescibacteria group bacterium]|nr:UvrD-helicase domain-containing protein [Patescibacteria group bacterium]MBU3999620.1 UvrD-helicase domain-containing protein [Patescibacteria group bacterium]MBU4056383.1 UvrD-helicase domain-containing protein [Patescibacteria group bacterium]MBU4368948.1 UvrD-helicase domain-containing protein [Patescibacteria group bacterium]
MSKLLEGLNEKQKEAVVLTDGPVLVVAGPGSGKTKVLTHRIAYLIKEKKIDPSRILAVTFTNRAAEEMKSRVAKLLGREDNRNGQYPALGTFHSISNLILRHESKALGVKSSFVIYDEDDSISLVKKVMEEAKIDPKQFQPSRVRYAISAAKNELIGWKDYAEQATGLWQKTVAKIYEYYQKGLGKNNAYDFDDLICELVKLFKDNSEVLQKYQKKFQYILVDEYQDTNYAQYLLVKMLADTRKNICVVGDTDQGIYSWRGADIKNILAFERDWPSAKIIFLEENYRSTQKILEAAQKLITKNALRREKKIFSAKEKGSPIFIFEAASEKDEAGFIGRTIKDFVGKDSAGEKRKIGYGDFAVFYRVNAQSRAIEEELIKAALPYRIIGGQRFYGRKEIKDILAYLKFIQNPIDLVSLTRIINVPARGIGEKTAKIIFDNLAETGQDLISWVEKTDFEKIGLSAKVSKSLYSFIEIIKNFQLKACAQGASAPGGDPPRAENLEKAIKQLLKNISYEEYLKSSSLDSEAKIENIRELIAVVKKFNDLPLAEAINNFLSEASLFEGGEAARTQKSDVINLMTLHSAKGLEFRFVFIAGMEEGILPHSRSLNSQNELEEERRLAYVGITRAKERVYLTRTRARNLAGLIQANLPSRFLYEIPEELMERIENYNQN